MEVTSLDLSTLYYIVKSTIALITRHFVKFHENMQTPWHSSKFHDPLKTVGPTYYAHDVKMHTAYLSDDYLPPNQQRQSTEGNFCLQCFDAVGWAAGRASGL